MKDKLEFLKRPWLILREAYEILAGYDLEKCEASPVLGEIKLSEFEEKIVDAGNGIAIIDIDGPLMPSPGLAARFFLGAVDVHRVTSLIRSAHAAPSVNALILRVNSPGGTVTGTLEAADAVKACVDSGKPVYTFSRGVVASAAYWIGAHSSEIVGTPSSRWGSIGAIRPHIDMSEAHRQAGMKIELFTSGKHKGAGALGTTLSEDQRAAIKEEIDDLGERFRAHVEASRDIDREDMEAQVFYGDKALEKGFIDDVVADFDELFARVSQKHGSGISLALSSGSVDTGLFDNSGNSQEAPLSMKDENENPQGADAPGQASGAFAEGEAGDDGANLGGAPSGESIETTKLETRLNALEGKLDTLLTKLESNAPREGAPDDATAREAARIAAESGTSALDSDAGAPGASSGEDFSQLNDSQKWDKYSEILASKGRNEARAFYVKHIEQAA